MASGVYKIVNTITGKVYIGSSSNLEKREYAHFYYLERNNHANKHLQSAYLKYGKESFIFRVIMNCPVSDLIKMEQETLDSYNL